MTYSNPLTAISAILKQTSTLDKIEGQTRQIARLIVEAKKSDKIITIFGNGGSAADSQHWAAELVCTYQSRDREPYPALALTTDSSIITAWSNDFKYEDVFSRQIEAFSSINGLSIGLSTSGRSVNVLKALTTAKSCSAQTILISGDAVEEFESLDLHVRIPASDTPTVQTLTQLVYHRVCDHLESFQ